jgi:hypothetical protein
VSTVTVPKADSKPGTPLGDRLNRCLAPYRCPNCAGGRLIDVHVFAVRWHCCEHRVPLPPLHVGRYEERCPVCAERGRQPWAA